MNVIISNNQQNQLSTLDIDIIKSISGTYDAKEIVEMFKNFFYSKMILDVTAIKNYNDINNFQVISQGLDVEKIIFFLPEGSNLCTSNFLSQLITMGIYNFTTNLDGVKYLLKKPNTFKDVEHIQKLAGASSSVENITQNIGNKTIVIGIKNITDQAGATNFTYILKKELVPIFGQNVIALEVDKNDFRFFNDKSMISISSNDVRAAISKYSNSPIILIDMNDLQDDSMCDEVLFLLEPSTIKLNSLVQRNRAIFGKLKNKKVILNKSLLSNKDVSDFEYESSIKVFYNMPPLNERKKNEIVSDFLARMGLLSKPDNERKDNSRIFGLFRR